MRKLFLNLVLAVLAGCAVVEAPEGDPSAELTPATPAEIRRAKKLAFAERLAANGIVLLKNEGNLLPLAEGTALARPGEAGDRSVPCLASVPDLSSVGAALVSAACETSDNVIVLIRSAAPVDTSLLEYLPVKAVLHVPPLGEVPETAVADILYGRAAPGGRTAEAWPDYPLGHGLSYTTFRVLCGRVSRDGTRFAVPVTVRNTGARKGSEVVQAYLAHLGGRSPRRLCGFAKTKTLAPDAVQRFALAFDVREFPAGRYALRVGTSAASAREVFRFTLTEEEIARAKAASAPAPVPELPPSPFEARVTLFDARIGIATVEQVVAQYSDAELAAAVTGNGERAARGILPGGIAWPGAKAVAQGWDALNAEWYGRLVADDMILAGVRFWQAPEGWSAEPFLAEEMARAVRRGVETKADGSPTGRFEAPEETDPAAVAEGLRTGRLARGAVQREAVRLLEAE